MTKRKLKIIFITVLFVAVFCSALCGCTSTPKEEIDSVELLNNLLETYVSSPQKISGRAYLDGKLQNTYDGVMSKNDLKLYVKMNDDDYYYSAKTLIKNNTVLRIDTTLSEQKELLPYNLYYYTYDKGNGELLLHTDSTIVVGFVRKGVKRSFATTKDTNMGTLSITYKDGNITDSVLSTSIIDGDKAKKLVIYYHYEKAEKVFDTLPNVLPSEDNIYLSYLMNKLTTLYSDKTIKTSTNFDTGAKISDVITDNEKISTITVVDITSEQQYYTLTVNYKTKLLVTGVSSNVEKFLVAFTSDYEVKYLMFNSTKYYLN